MKRSFSMMSVLALCVVLSPFASAQGRGGGRGFMGGGGLMLLNIPEVQTELKMTPEQIGKIQAKQQEVRDAQRQVMQDAGGPQEIQNLSPEDRQKLFAKIQGIQQKAVSEILDATQMKRFHQLELQQAGPSAFSRKDVADELKLTKEQTDKLADIQREAMQAMMDARQGFDPQNASPEDQQKMQAKMAELRKSSDDKALAVLTADQQKQWQAMLGEPFKFPARGPGGGRRQGGGA